jgi:hypothetical protein
MASMSPVSTNRPRRGAPPACEPTVTCETYRYEVFPAPPEKIVPGPRESAYGLAGLASIVDSDLFREVACCLQPLTDSLPEMPAANASQTTQSNWCCTMRQAMIQYLMLRGGTDCEAIARLQAIQCPSAELNPQAFAAAMADARNALILVFAEILVGCLCSGALPPCPPPGDPRVPLATVRVRVKDCSIVSVCDWTPLRKHVVTVKTLAYWLGWLPFSGLLRRFMEELCCNLFGLRDQLAPQKSGAVQSPSSTVSAAAPAMAADTVPGGGTGGAGSAGGGGDQPINLGGTVYHRVSPLSEAMAATLLGGGTSLTAADLAAALFSRIDPGAPGDDKAAERLAQTPHVKVLGEIARPALDSFAPLLQAAMGGAVGMFGRHDELAEMRERLDTLHQTVTAQAGEIAALRSGGTPA